MVPGLKPMHHFSTHASISYCPIVFFLCPLPSALSIVTENHYNHSTL